MQQYITEIKEKKNLEFTLPGYIFTYSKENIIS